MGLLSWLFGERQTAPSPRTQAASRAPEADDFQSRFIEIPSRDFFGQCSRSPNERFTLAWRDGSGTRGGARESGHGRYLLLDGDKVVADGRMERPNDGKVADNGVFILNDWRFTSDLSGTFFAFQPDGRKILSRAFAANLYNNGLAANGDLAVCQTCNAPDSADSSMLAIFDLIAGTEIGSCCPESGWANSYVFPAGERTVQLDYKERGAFTYDVSGKFIDRDRWIDASLRSGDLVVVKSLLDEANGEPTAELASRLMASIDIALRADHDSDPWARARGLKFRGVCLEATKSPAEALRCYDEALSLDPHIGVKRRAAQLRKPLTKPSGET